MKVRREIAMIAAAILPFLGWAQQTDSISGKSQQAQIEQLDEKVTTLDKQLTTLDKLVNKLSKFKVSAYIQGQYQYGQKEASLKVGDKNEDIEKSFNRFGIRRGRIKFEYIDGIGQAAIQLEVNDKGISFRDLYIGVKDPWIGRNSLMAGVFNRPFGNEVGYSTSGLESPERATIIQNFFPDERDLGVMLTLQTKKESPLDFLKLEAGLFSGNSINMDTDNKKDFIGHLTATKPIGNWGTWGLGVSYYNGSVFNPTTTAYEMHDKTFVPVDKGKTGTFMKREYYGLDGQFSVVSSWGKSTFRAEGLFGVQPGIAGSSKSPNYSKRPDDLPENALYKRNFNGYFFTLVQDIGTSPFSAVLKYDVYDPNTEVKGNEVGMENSHTSKTDLAQSTVGLGGLWRINKNLRLQAYYEFNKNEKSAYVKGYEKDRKDDVFTLRLQYKF